MPTRKALLVPMVLGEGYESGGRRCRNRKARMQSMFERVICGVCEHEWPGPADGACPRCGNLFEDHVPMPTGSEGT